MWDIVVGLQYKFVEKSDTKEGEGPASGMTNGESRNKIGRKLRVQQPFSIKGE